MPSTPNFTLPLLYAAQAQKEITHNEALVLIDALLAGVIVAMANDPAGLSPQPGEAFIVGDAPVGLWAAQARRIAIFSDGGWRFAPPVTAMRLFDRTAGIIRRFDGSNWLGYPAIADATGGSVVDAEARNTLAAVLVALRQAGLAAVT